MEPSSWVAGYERAWRSPGTEALDALFTPDATYLMRPYASPVVGIDAIAGLWEAERESPSEVFTLTTSVLAASGDTAVVRALVRYGEPVTEEWSDLWVIRFAPDGRCAAFEEWPFAAPR